MSLDAPKRNKMMQVAPEKKGYHFASDGVHEAMYVEAENLLEASKIYELTKRLIIVSVQSTVLEAPAEEEKEVQ